MNEIEHPKSKGQVSEAKAIFEFVRREIPVLEPFGDNERYDLVVELQDRFVRVQIKTGRLENGRIQFETRSSGTLTRKIEKQDYVGDADVFCVYSPEHDEVFIVPVDEAPKTTMGLRVENPKKPSPNINRAEEYTVGRWLEKNSG